jgi:hypothetical protein
MTRARFFGGIVGAEGKKAQVSFLLISPRLKSEQLWFIFI